MSENKPTHNKLHFMEKEIPQLQKLIALNAKESADVEVLAMQELEYLRMLSVSTPSILNCMPQTIVMAVKTVLRQNLSLDPNQGLVYVQTRNVKIEVPGGNPQWKKALEITPSANGLISINRQAGRILDIKNPVVIKDESGKVTGVYVEIMLPSVPNPRWDKREFDESDFERWAKASHKQNGRGKQDANADTLNYANDNYTSFKGGIDPEFARAKAIRHGLKKLGLNLNEGKLKNVQYEEGEAIVIDPAADSAAAGDSEAVPYEVVDVVDTDNPNPAISPNENFTEEKPKSKL